MLKHKIPLIPNRININEGSKPSLSHPYDGCCAYGKMFVIEPLRSSCYHYCMKEQVLLTKPVKPKFRFHPPDIGNRAPCDFRLDLNDGMTLKQIAEKYHCDQRTVRTCILLNKSSGDLGKQNAPTKLQPYIDEVESLFQSLIDQSSGQKPFSTLSISRQITMIISEHGYAGSERTVRNYLYAHCIKQDH